MAQQRTYRVPKATAPKLVFELSRLATRHGSSTDTVAVFRAPAGTLELRTAPGGRTLTAQGPAGERSVALGAGPLEELLDGVGLPRELSYLNEREVYQYLDTSVSLDHIAPLGWFCVISAERAADIDSCAAGLGLSSADLEQRAYAYLLRLVEQEGTTQVAPVVVPSPIHAPQPLPAPEPAGAGPGSASGRTFRLLAIVAIAIALALMLDVALGAIAAVALVLLEWGFGGGRQAGAPTR